MSILLETVSPDDLEKWFNRGGGDGSDHLFDGDSGGGGGESPEGFEPYGTSHLVGRTALTENRVHLLEARHEAGEHLSFGDAALLREHEDLMYLYEESE